VPPNTHTPPSDHRTDVLGPSRFPTLSIVTGDPCSDPTQGEEVLTARWTPAARRILILNGVDLHATSSWREPPNEAGHHQPPQDQCGEHGDGYLHTQASGRRVVGSPHRRRHTTRATLAAGGRSARHPWCVRTTVTTRLPQRCGRQGREPQSHGRPLTCRVEGATPGQQYRTAWLLDRGDSTVSLAAPRFDGGGTRAFSLAMAVR